jgi:hypothetical protein
MNQTKLLQQKYAFKLRDLWDVVNDTHPCLQHAHSASHPESLVTHSTSAGCEEECMSSTCKGLYIYRTSPHTTVWSGLASLAMAMPASALGTEWLHVRLTGNC